MQRRQLTHAAIAEMAGVSVSTINDWAAGGVPHDLEKVGALAQRLGISFAWLVLNREEQFREPAVADLFDEVADDRLTGLWRIEARRLTPRKKT